MEKQDILSDVASKLKALDNDVKLKILTLLVEDGTKSITDISKELNINFSTAHKYLERLEKAKLVTSKQVADNRLKRLFYVKDFNIDLSPTGIANLFAGTKKKEKSKFKVINEHGEVVDFDEKLFSQKYLKRGLPRGLISYALSSVLDQTYDGITLLEMRELFQNALEKRAKDIDEVLMQIEESQRHKRTFAHLMALVHPEALEQHAKGDIFIKNLREPKLLNFVHDARGIAVHGVTGKTPKKLDEFLQHMIKGIKTVSMFSYPYQSIDSFNYVLAPFTAKMNTSEITAQLKKFVKMLEGLDINFCISLDIGLSEFASIFGPSYIYSGEGKETYAKYKDEAQKINSIFIKIFKEEKTIKVLPIFKLWQKQMPDLKGLRNFFIINMVPKWQLPSATYAGALRFDADWQKWTGLFRVGEIQDIAINLPRLALKTKTKDKFFKELETMANQCIEYLGNMAELTFGEFLRKHKTKFKSSVKENWDYVRISDCTYSLSITGLEEAAAILTKNAKEKEKMRLAILERCNKLVKKKDSPIRICLRESQNRLIANRFYYLDSINQKLNFNKYHRGIESDNLKSVINLQKYLLGGHCARIRYKDLKDLSGKEFGSVFVA